METLLIVLAGIGAVLLVVALIAVLVDTERDLKLLEKDGAKSTDYYRKLYFEAADEASDARNNRDELRKVLASAILADKNYLAVDPEAFDALPEDFVISKTTDVGASGDNTILVYQVSPREVGGVKLQNQFL